MQKIDPLTDPGDIEFCHYVEAKVRFLQNVMNLGEYEVDFGLVDDFPPDSSYGDTYAMIVPDTVYLTASISVGRCMAEMYANGDYKMVGAILLHEMSHLLTEPLWHLVSGGVHPAAMELVSFTNERQVQRIANVINSLLPNKWYMPEKEEDANSAANE